MLHFASERPISEAPLTNIATKTVPSDIRANNTMAVFNLLFPATHMSRVELRRHIGLSRMAISKVTEEMTDHRIIRETGIDNRTGRGKRSTVLAIDTAYWRVIAIDLTQSFVIRGALVDLCGRIVQRGHIRAYAPHAHVDLPFRDAQQPGQHLRITTERPRRPPATQPHVGAHLLGRAGIRHAHAHERPHRRSVPPIQGLEGTLVPGGDPREQIPVTRRRPTGRGHVILRMRLLPQHIVNKRSLMYVARNKPTVHDTSNDTPGRHIGLSCVEEQKLTEEIVARVHYRVPSLASSWQEC